MAFLAHRCGMSRGTENTMEAIEQAYCDDADAFECDVRMTADGVPVVIHDPDLIRVAHNGGRISQMTAAELNQVRLYGGEHIPSVAEVMDFVRTRYWRVIFELKDSSARLAKKMIDQQAEHRLVFEQCQFLTYAQNAPVLTNWKQEYPNINTSAMFKIPRQLVERAKKLNLNTICFGWRNKVEQWLVYGMAEFFLLQKEITKAHQQDLTVLSGITAEPSAIKYLAKLGVDGIWSNDILALRSAIEKIK